MPHRYNLLGVCRSKALIGFFDDDAVGGLLADSFLLLVDLELLLLPALHY